MTDGKGVRDVEDFRAVAGWQGRCRVSSTVAAEKHKLEHDLELSDTCPRKPRESKHIMDAASVKAKCVVAQVARKLRESHVSNITNSQQGFQHRSIIGISHDIPNITQRLYPTRK